MKTLTTEEVLKDLGRANFKNIRNIKDIRNLKTFKDLTPSDDLQMDNSVSLASPQAEPVKEALASMGNSPSWKYAKLDLYDNSTPDHLRKNKRKLNLNLAFLIEGQTKYQYAAAGLNTSFRFFKRGFDSNIPEESKHQLLVTQIYQAVKQMGYEPVQVSKCYEKARNGKGSTIFGLSVVCAAKPSDGEYYCVIIDQECLYDVNLSNKGLTDAQRKSNCIASGFTGQTGQRGRTTRNSFFGGA
jgi:hypothetical protein